MNYSGVLGDTHLFYSNQFQVKEYTPYRSRDSLQSLQSRSSQELHRALKHRNLTAISKADRKSLSPEKMLRKQDSTPKFTQGSVLGSFLTQLHEEIHNEITYKKPAKSTRSTMFQSVQSSYDTFSGSREASPASKLLRPTFSSTAKYSPPRNLSTSPPKNRSSSKKTIISPHKISQELRAGLEKEALNSEEKREVKRRLRSIVKEKKKVIASQAFEKLCNMNSYKLFDEEINEIRADSFYRVEMNKLRTSTIPKLVNYTTGEVRTERNSPKFDIYSSPYSKETKKSQELIKLNSLLIKRRKSIIRKSNRKLDDHEKEEFVRFISEKIKYNATEGIKNRSVSPVPTVYPQLNISRKMIPTSLNIKP
jgi:hypothetical protein